MNQISTTWNPPNGFDHVAFTVYIGLPGRDDGASAEAEGSPVTPGVTPAVDRALGPVADPSSLGGGAAVGLPVMDHSGVITLP